VSCAQSQINSVPFQQGAQAFMAANPSIDELEKKEEELYHKGPLSVLTTSVKTNCQVC
jgi:hypothetical protein